ncbi:unnamed protein product [Cylindrotheca closterium]|uniref:RING-type domain-containing protein n=1 Tax=Cylindrotheca closterium TaxID=2856 RepID=A0AAD2FUS1_9STRA|nr:unnamed protein product [Cylindrotheca closterium]
MPNIEDSSSSMEDEHLIVEASPHHEQGGNNSAPLVLLRRQQQEQRWRYHLSRSGSATRFHRIFIRPLLVFLIGFWYLQRRSIVGRKDQRHQQRPELEKESSYWRKPSLSPSSSSSSSASNLDFHIGNEHSFDSTSSSESISSSHTVSNSSPDLLVSSSSHMNKQAFHEPYFPLYASVLQASSEDSPDADDPESFGWEPSLYPNPRENPQQCGISYLLQDEHFIHPNDTDNTLQLCDPDWVLGGIYLEEIGAAMNNFVETYSSLPLPDTDNMGDTPPPIDRAKNESPVNESLASPNLEDTSIGEASVPFVELGIATVRKMEISAVLEQDVYYSSEDEDDMVSDAAQVFARYLHDRWWQGNPNGEYGILIFLSIEDQVCFISTGNAIAKVLPWWRLEHTVSIMKPDLRHRDFGHALLTAIHDLSDMLAEGPPTLADRFHDFMTRFGIVIAFAVFTFFFGALGELRDRRKRWAHTESRSKMSQVEREKARLLQREFKTRSCPICLENFDGGTDSEGNLYQLSIDDEKHREEDVDSEDRGSCCRSCCTPKSIKEARSPDKEQAPINSGLRRVDSYGIPLLGPDHRNVKMLRCGHIFCESCWKQWVHSGQGNPSVCPVCRQDVGKSSKHRRRRRQQQLQHQQQEEEEARSQEQQLEEAANAASPTLPNTDTTPLMNNASTRTSGGTYDSLSSYRTLSRLDGADEETGHGDSITVNTRTTNDGQEDENGEGDQDETQSLLRNGSRRARRNWFMS